MEKHRGFTLIELLTVIAIIAILAGILIPTVSSVRVSAKKAETKVRFNQWALAMEQFRQEYGYYPQIDGTTPNKVDSEYFAGALTGRQLNGEAFDGTTNAKLAGNKRLIAFYALSDKDVNTDGTALVDAFGNSDIAVYYDKNGDGRITVADSTSTNTARVKAAGAAEDIVPDETDFDLATDKGVRAGVIFYSAGRGDSSGDLILSWK